ncbi:hypothetical protein PC128_g18837 [Phytophthora cactorum]|nr:hypothetical protein PC128_g18837 [Phytophthora cactorum]
MRKHKLYANLKKCIFGASEIRILGCLVGKSAELRQSLGLATYLCKHVENYAGKIRPPSQLLKKEAEWKWTAELADQDRPFHVVCDAPAPDFAIGCALMQHDHESRDRVA